MSPLSTLLIKKNTHTHFIFSDLLLLYSSEDLLKRLLRHEALLEHLILTAISFFFFFFRIHFSLIQFGLITIISRTNLIFTQFLQFQKVFLITNMSLEKFKNLSLCPDSPSKKVSFFSPKLSSFWKVSCLTNRIKLIGAITNHTVLHKFTVGQGQTIT